MKRKLLKIYKTLLSAFGPQHWWPGKTKVEICVGAILTQNTNWQNVELAIRNLKKNKVLNIKGLFEIPETKLAELIRPSGFYNIKTKRLKNFINFIIDFSGETCHGTSLRRLFKLPIPELRTKLLSVNGIGEETADSIILYAAKKPIFVIDSYTRRLVERHFGFTKKAKYSDIQKFFMDNLDHDVELFNEYHALIVKLGKEFCKPKPRCKGCPIASLRSAIKK